MYKLILFIWFLSGYLYSQSIIGSGLTKENLFNYLYTNYKIMPKANILCNPDTGDIFFVNKIIKIKQYKKKNGFYKFCNLQITIP